MKNRKCLFIFIILLGFILRFPFVGAGMPYFQNEDEMHHFNRTVKMMQEGSFNPKYFLKPSLHFYLRIPVTAIAFIWNVKKNNIQKLSDIKITNIYGLSNYSSTASHPGIVKWNKTFSLALSILTLILIFFIIKELTNNYYTSIIGTALFALAPPQIELSTQINVDIPVMFFCVLTTFIAIKTYNKFSLLNFTILSLLSGFAISTKYNAAPIYFLPLFTLFVSNKLSLKTTSIALIVPILGFFIASPYAFINYNIFLDHLAYEVKHYGVDGHIGHIEKPGLSQLIFYIKWFCKYAIGVIPFILCLYGVFIVCIKNYTNQLHQYSVKKHLIVALFPLLFILLMVFQKANFTRNMLMALPYLCIFAGIGFSKFAENIIKNNEARKKLLPVFILLFFLQPTIQTLIVEKKVLSLKDTRKDVSVWVRKNANFKHNIFVSGQLELEHDIFNLQNVNKINQNTPLTELYNSNGSFLILPKYIKNHHPELYKKHLLFKGQKKDPNNRLYLNPNIVIYKKIPVKSLQTKQLERVANDTSSFLTLDSNKNLVSIKCNKQTTDNKNQDCWVTSLISKINAKNINLNSKNFKISYVTPWENQKVSIVINDEVIDITCDNLKAWEACEKEVKLPENNKNLNEIYLITNKLISPLAAKFSKDERFLGIMIK